MSYHLSKTIYFFDVDETLYHQENGLIHVLDYNNKRVNSITNEVYNTYKLPPGFHYDFSDFASSDRFVHSAKPIQVTIDKLKSLIEKNKNMENPDLIIILTARGDFDDKNMVLSFFDKEGIPIQKYDFVQFVRTGNINDTVWSTPMKKQSIILTAAITNRFNKFVMVDDSIANLEKFYDIKKAILDQEHVKFEINHVIHDIVDGNHCNYQIIEVEDENIRKYIDIYRAKRTLERYNIPIYDPSVADVKVGKREMKEVIDKPIVSDNKDADEDSSVTISVNLQENE